MQRFDMQPPSMRFEELVDVEKISEEGKTEAKWFFGFSRKLKVANTVWTHRFRVRRSSIA